MAKKIITDEELTLKRQARRRLVGAIALTTLVVILLPMILDREPPAPSQDIELQIPDKDKAGEFVPQMVLPPISADEAASQLASAPVIAPLLDAKPPVAVPVQANPVPAVQPKPVVETKPKVEPKPAAVKPRVEAPIKPVPLARPAGKTHSGFIVQVGAFANADAAKALQQKLHKQGYPSYTEKSGDKTRVRIGDYATHAEAEKVQHKLETQGLQPNVVNLN